jgi:glucose-1-phosphatase
MKLKNLIFDLGQVILDLDFNATKKAFEAIGFHNHADMFGKYSGNQTFLQFECGLVSEEAFYDTVKTVGNLHHMSNQQIAQAWNAMLLHVPPARLQLLTRLRGQYQIFLYSNTNCIHYKRFQEQFQIDYPAQQLDNYFDKAYYSHKFGMRKPNVESYKVLLDDAQIQAHETLFIDDGDANIEGAKQAGLHTLLVEPTFYIEDNLLDYLKEKYPI